MCSRYRLAVPLFVLCVIVSAHAYTPNDRISLQVGKIGPFYNPTETYRFYSLPFCSPQDIEAKPPTLYTAFEGTRLAPTLFDIRFRVNEKDKPLCNMTLNTKEVQHFREAVDREYQFEMYYDNIPFHGRFGLKVSKQYGTPKFYLFKHFHFHITYNGPSVISANVTSSTSERHLVDITEEKPKGRFAFTYTVDWVPTKISKEESMKRMEGYYDEELEIQWFSIINSLVIVTLLTGFLIFLLLRILKKDYQTYADMEEEDEKEETGWKLLHGDVFRFPPNKNLFSACIGVGAQLLTLSFLLLLLAVVGIFYPTSRGYMVTAIVLSYALTAGIAGYVSSSFFRRMEGKNWVRNVIITVSLYTLPVFVVWSFMNSVAWAYNSTAALPFSVVFLIFVLWSLVSFPLTLFGAILGKRGAGSFEAPCRPRLAAREIPPGPWYISLPVQMAVAGFLPFSAIYVELYYVFISMWGYAMYTPFGILLLVFIILLAVVSCITIALVYFQFTMEDHEWWWNSFLNGGSTAVFIYAYSYFFLKYQSRMTGFLQISFYFGYMFLICYAFFLMLGTVGFYSSLVFVRRIFSAVKSD